MSLSFDVNPLFLVFALIAAGGASFWFYQKTIPQLSTRRRLVLSSLRFLTLATILFLLFEPAVHLILRQEQPAVLAVLVDNSQSLTISASSEDSLEVYPHTPIVDLLDELKTRSTPYETQFYLFDGETERLDEMSSVDFSGARTDISQALQYVAEDAKETNLGGVLLISDGQYNTGQNPLYVAEQYPVPVFTIVIGDTTEQRDVQIRRINTNEIAYVGMEQPVQIGLRTTSNPGEHVTVTLLSGGQIRDVQNVSLPDGTAEIPIDLSYIPDEEGLQRIRVSVSHLPGETTYLNNDEMFAVRVLERKRRILLVADAPSPDVSSLRHLLSSDPSIEVESMTQKGRQTFYEGSFPSSLENIDIIVLAGFPGRYPHPAAVQQIVQEAENGKPLFFILSRQTDLNALRSYFSTVLPAIPIAVRPGLAEVVFVPTPVGSQHPILDIESISSAWTNLPPLIYNLSRWEVKPDAQTLATTEIRGVPLDDPLLVIHTRAGIRSASLLGAGTWRWHDLPEDLNTLSSIWPSLLSNGLQWLGASIDFRPVRIQTTSDIYGGGERVQFVGQVYDESLNAVADALVEVAVTAPDGNRFPYLLESLGSGRYFLDVGALPEGTYLFTATAERDTYALGTDEGSFAVGQLFLEYKETRADVSLLRQIAQRSGGRHFSPPIMGSLSERLSLSDSFNPRIIEQNLEKKLWHIYLFLIFLVTLLTIEWFLRKRSGMV